MNAAERRAELELVIRSAKDAGEGHIIVPYPEMLGSDYEERSPELFSQAFELFRRRSSMSFFAFEV